MRSPSRSKGHLPRRSFLRIGAVGAGTLGLADLLRAESKSSPGAARSAIVVVLEGGPSHVDTFDPKPDAPTETRGEFGTIGTAIPGVRFSEHLPKLAAGLSEYTLIRSASHTLADHRLGREYVLTGTRPLASLQYPEYAASLAHFRPSPAEVPTSVAIPKSEVGPGFLGPAYSSFETRSYPSPGRNVSIPSLALSPELTLERLDKREALLRRVDEKLNQHARLEPALDAMDRYSRQAYAMLRSPKTREAFDLKRERSSFAAPFGRSQFGQGCLLAIRLVEAGVRCVTLTLGGWDTHDNLFPRLKNRLLPELDEGLSALFAGLRLRGLRNSTAVLVTGEFGRTPQLNDRANPGREHHAQAMFMLIGGGRAQQGLVYGKTDATGRRPTEEQCSPEDVAATFYANLGIDPKTVLTTSDGRPVTLVRDGNPIPDLLS